MVLLVFEVLFLYPFNNLLSIQYFLHKNDYLFDISLIPSTQAQLRYKVYFAPAVRYPLLANWRLKEDRTHVFLFSQSFVS